MLVAYDVNNPGQNRDQILHCIRKYPHVPLSESAYAIETDASPETIYREIDWWVDDNDRFYVVPLLGPCYGQGPTDHFEWLGVRLP